jgi:hypothetical protein
MKTVIWIFTAVVIPDVTQLSLFSLNSLRHAVVQTAVTGGTGSVANLVEHCDCPLGYTGLSCEACGYGFTHVGPSPGHGECRLCDCNGHASTCDPVTGKCAVSILF